MAADAEKMYRQILVHEEDRSLQQIIWTSHSEDKITTFCLNTVTYGLACAPFLAVRTLQQLARDENTKFPRGSSVLLRDVYVDIFTGANTIEEALQIQGQLIQLCKAGGFPLKKWAANSNQLTENTPEEDRMKLKSRS
ncbi:hypothetical protein RF55_12826 [Lasius niger]|uniref:Reverse transcriptase domain-containing protein n=1 Tax=Lasius niger TaxID=67767 RepID=A0A0J7KBY4_LASNI|nr:hypothetical protein RF55_12826 [Lasius niger]